MRRMHVQALLSYEWDTVSGVIAAVVAMVLSFFDIVSPTTVRAILLLIVGLILLRELRKDSREAQYAEHIDIMRQDIRGLLEKVGGSDVTVIAPTALRNEFQDFAAHLSGTVIWYNACCGMFVRQEAFDSTLGQLIKNPKIDAVRMLCNHGERPVWESDIADKVRQQNAGKKVGTPLWGELSTPISFLIGIRRGDNHPLALLAIMEEPFASRGRLLRVPRYLFRVQNNSAILTEFREMARTTTTEFEQAGKRLGQPDRKTASNESDSSGEPSAGGAAVPRVRQ